MVVAVLMRALRLNACRRFFTSGPRWWPQLDGVRHDGGFAISWQRSAISSLLPNVQQSLLLSTCEVVYCKHVSVCHVQSNALPCASALGFSGHMLVAHLRKDAIGRYRLQHLGPVADLRLCAAGLIPKACHSVDSYSCTRAPRANPYARSRHCR